MTGIYNEKSCSSLAKPYYRPIEAALRWCGLISHEVKILTATGENHYPALGVFPQWPCLRTNAEIIFDAIENGDLPHGRDGKTVAHGDHVAKGRLTIRHSDLKAWMLQHNPSQKPPFLFDEVERNTHASINANSFRALQVDRDALKVRIENAEVWHKKTVPELKRLQEENKSLRDSASELATTERNTLLTIIAALCDYSKIEHQGRGAAAQIARLTEASEARVSEDAISKALKKIPIALESRMK